MVALLLALLSASPCSAETLTWTEARREAAGDNAELRAARENLEAAEADLKSSYSGFLPDLDGNLGVTRGNSTGGSSSAVPDVSRERTSYTANLALTQNLFAGFLDRGKVAQGMANVTLSQATVDAARAKLSYELRSAYAGLVYAQESVQLSRAIMKRQEDNLRLVTLRFEGGRENKGSQLLSKATLAQARYETLQAEQQIETSRQDLARVLGREGYAELTVSGAADPVAVPAKPELEQIALITPAYRQAVARTTVSEAQVTQSRARFMPTLGATANVGRLGDEFFPSDQDRWSVSATLSYPFFAGGADYYGLKSAQRSAASAALTQADTARRTLASLRGAFTDAMLAGEKLKVDTEFVQASDLRAEIARNKYNNGLLTFEDWILIENDLINRQRTRLQSERQKAIAEAAWEQAQGRGVIE